MQMECEKVADGEADNPVADDLNDEASVSVAGAAECSGGGDLQAVEELEDGGNEEQRDRCGDDRWVFGEAACDEVREEKDDGGENSHGSCSEGDGGPARGGSLGRGAATDGLTDANCGRCRDGEGNHEGEARAVEGDLVACEREAAHRADEEGHHAEDGDLDEDLPPAGAPRRARWRMRVGSK